VPRTALDDTATEFAQTHEVSGFSALKTAVALCSANALSAEAPNFHSLPWLVPNRGFSKTSSFGGLSPYLPPLMTRRSAQIP
jgi:hypothetical protein